MDPKSNSQFICVTKIVTKIKKILIYILKLEYDVIKPCQTYGTGG
jgi:hypothetical protein